MNVTKVLQNRKVEMREKIGKTIKRLREQKKITTIDLAKHLQVSPGTISQWENGKSVPCRKNVLAIEKFFNVPDLRSQGSLEVMDNLDNLNSLAGYFHSLDVPTQDLAKLDDNAIELAIKSSDIIAEKVKRIKKIKEAWTD